MHGERDVNTARSLVQSYFGWASVRAGAIADRLDGDVDAVVSTARILRLPVFTRSGSAWVMLKSAGSQRRMRGGDDGLPDPRAATFEGRHDTVEEVEQAQRSRSARLSSALRALESGRPLLPPGTVYIDDLVTARHDHHRAQREKQKQARP